MKAIKVVKRVGGRLVSQYLQSLLERDEAGQIRWGPDGLLSVEDIKAAMVEYTPGEWASPKPGAGPLCAWKPLIKGQVVSELFHDGEVWECEVKLWKQKLPRITIINPPMRFIAALWPPVDSRFCCPWIPIMLPRGTLLCEAVKLTRRIK